MVIQKVLTEVNFFSADEEKADTICPFIAKLTGSGAVGADYDVLARGETIFSNITTMAWIALPRKRHSQRNK